MVSVIGLFGQLGFVTNIKLYAKKDLSLWPVYQDLHLITNCGISISILYISWQICLAICGCEHMNVAA
jgi:hypothetical protein